MARFEILIGAQVLVLSAHHATAPAPMKPLQEIALPSGAKLLCASVTSMPTFFASLRLLALTISGNQSALLWTTQGAFMCSPHTPPQTLFFHLLADPRSRSAADTLATALGMDLASLYEEAAERAMAEGEAGLAVELCVRKKLDICHSLSPRALQNACCSP